MKNFFKGISIPQIVAGALAAVTSFLLSAKIGIAGSVIGVAAGSIVSAVSSQLYQNILKASSEKLQDVAGANNDGSDGDAAQADGDEASGNAGAANGKPQTRGRRAASGRQPGGDETAVLSAGGTIQTGDTTRAMDAVASDATTVIGADGDATRVIGSVKPGATAADVAANGRQGRVIVSGEGPGRPGVTGHPLAASQERARRNKRVAIIVSVVSALVAVGITAGIIMLVTRGQGTDSVVRDMVGTTKVTPTPTPSDTGASTGSDDKSHKRPDDEPSSSASASPSSSASPTPSSSASSSASQTSGTGSQTGGSSSSSTSSSGSSTGTSGSTDSGTTANGSGSSDSGTGAGTDSGKDDSSNTGSSSSGSTGTQGDSSTSGSGSGSATGTN
ncbi:hypothetical protein [Bifidobacterium thermophilum]|uniref:hypothetical protein n=1 Tax=Bifidobacterium thermophilum TaxID=33905 RepID=UPI00309B4883